MGKKEIKPILCDSNILIEFLNGNEVILEALRKLGLSRTAFSIVTHAEVYAGTTSLICCTSSTY